MMSSTYMQPQDPHVVQMTMTGNDAHLIAISNVPFASPWQDVKDLVRDLTPRVTHVEVYKGPDGRSRGYGYIIVTGLNDARHVESSLDGKVWRGRSLIAKLVPLTPQVPNQLLSHHCNPAIQQQQQQPGFVFDPETAAAAYSPQMASGQPSTASMYPNSGPSYVEWTPALANAVPASPTPKSSSSSPKSKSKRKDKKAKSEPLIVDGSGRSKPL